MFPNSYFANEFFPGEFFPPVAVLVVGANILVIWIGDD